MRDTKRKLEFFSFYDHTGMERHLEEMAQQGWMVERMESLWWVYRRCEKRRVHVAVSYDVQSSAFDPDGAEGEREELCRHAGWQLVASTGKMKVYYNWEEDPLPMETDPRMEVESIHRAVRQSYLPFYGMYLLFGLFWVYDLVVDLIFDPIGRLSSFLQICQGVCGVILLLLAAVELAGYYGWRRKALRMAEQGVFLETKSHRTVQQVALWVVILLFVVWVVDGIFGRSPLIKSTVWCTLILLVFVTVVIPALRNMLKRRGVSREKNRMATLALAYGGSFVVICVLIGMVMRLDWKSWNAADVPLHAAQLLDVSQSDYDVKSWQEETLLLGQTEVWQLTSLDIPQGADIPDMIYTIVEVKASILYGMCQAQLLRQDTYQQVDAKLWGANVAYQKMSRGKALTSYVLCYDHQLVSITFGWEPTEEQMQLVGETFGGDML